MRDIAQRRRRILYLTKLFPYPPAVSGDAVYTRGLIETWASIADLTVLCGDSGAANASGAAGVKWRIVDAPKSGRAKSVFSRWPLIAWKGATPNYLSELDALLQDDGWDAVVLGDLGSAHALPRVEAYRRAHPKTKLIYVSLEWEYATRAAKYDIYGLDLPTKLMAKLDLRKVKHWENALITRCDVVTVINTSDLVPFRKIDSSRKYLPMAPGYDGPIVSARRIVEETPRRVLVLGGRRSEQKQQVLLDWLAVAYQPVIAAGIEMIVAGDISDDLHKQMVRQYPGIQILGYVEDLDTLISTARAGLITDTVGGGFKIRLLTHVFHRLPIIGLSEAIRGLPTPAGEGYLSADSLEELVTLVCEAVDDLECLNAVQNRAYDDCAREFSWIERANSLRMAVEGRDGSILL